MIKIRSLLVCVFSFILISIIFAPALFSASQNDSSLKNSPAAGAQNPPKIATEALKPKQYFWDMVVTHGVVNGKTIERGKQYKFYLKPGDILKCKFYYDIKTPNIQDITKADAEYWGTGKFKEKNIANIKHPQTNKYYNEKIHNKRSPRFTYEDVEKWKKTMKGGTQKVWSRNFNYSWTTGNMHVSSTPYFLQYVVNPGGDISEFYMADNYLCIEPQTTDHGQATVEIYVRSDPPAAYQRSTKPTATKKSTKQLPSVKVRK